MMVLENPSFYFSFLFLSHHDEKFVTKKKNLIKKNISFLFSISGTKINNLYNHLTILFVTKQRTVVLVKIRRTKKRKHQPSNNKSTIRVIHQF